MLTREDMLSLLDGLDENEVMSIQCEDFIGRGINGMSSKYTSINNQFKEDNFVDHRKIGEVEYAVYLKDLQLSDRYLRASYKMHKLHRDYDTVGLEYTVIVPYDRISSMEIRKMK